MLVIQCRLLFPVLTQRVTSQDDRLAPIGCAEALERQSGIMPRRNKKANISARRRPLLPCFVRFHVVVDFIMPRPTKAKKKMIEVRKKIKQDNRKCKQDRPVSLHTATSRAALAVVGGRAQPLHWSAARVAACPPVSVAYGSIWTLGFAGYNFGNLPMLLMSVCHNILTRNIF